MVPADSRRISRVPRYSGAGSPAAGAFGYGALTRCGAPFQALPLAPRHGLAAGPPTPRGPRPPRFGLWRFRSPLLALSLLFSFPPATKMFQFAGFAPAIRRVPESLPAGCPIRTSAANGGYLPLTAAFRSLSRPSSPPRAKASFTRPFLLPYDVRRFGSCPRPQGADGVSVSVLCVLLLSLLVCVARSGHNAPRSLPSLSMSLVPAGPAYGPRSWRITDSNR